MKAECFHSENSQKLTGEYFPVGVYNGRTIYEHSRKDYNGMWWSLRFEDSTNQWIFKWQSRQIRVGEVLYGSTIENCLGQPGQSEGYVKSETVGAGNQCSFEISEACSPRIKGKSII